MATQSDANVGEAALATAARRAWRVGALPSTFRAAVVGTSVERESYRRIAYRVERRDVSMRLAYAHGSKKKDIASIPPPGSIDPWAVDPRSLPTQTRALIDCPSCYGEKKVTCPTCVGEGRVRCSYCGGGGRVHGQRGPKNCPSCRGRGDVKCAECTRGLVRCGPCDALGRAYAWLEVDGGQSIQVRVHPRGGIAHLHEGIDDPRDFDRVSAASRVPLVQDSGWIDPVATDLAAELAVQLVPRTDRVLAQRIQRFESAVHVFQYATGVGKGAIRVTGQPPAVLPESDWRGLRRRTILGVMVGAALFVAALVTVGAYVGRAEWFVGHGNGGAIGAVGLLGAVFGAFALMGLLLPRSGRSLVRTTLPGALLVASWLGIAGLWRTNGPSVEHAEQAIDGGDLAAARLELEAAQAVDAKAEGAADAFARLEAAEAAAEQERRERADAEHLARIEHATDVEAGLAALQGEWNDEGRAEGGRDALLAIAAKDVEVAVAAKDPAELERLAKVVGPLDARLGELAAERAQLARADECIESKDFACAADKLGDWKAADGDDGGQALHDELDTKLATALADSITVAAVDEADLERRLTTLDATLAQARLYEKVSGSSSPRPIAALEKERKRTSTLVDKQRAKLAKQAERERKAEERKRKAAEGKARRAASNAAAAQRRAEARADRVSCCDGTLSPSCHYSQGSLRGCCSHHGGVC